MFRKKNINIKVRANTKTNPFLSFNQGDLSDRRNGFFESRIASVFNPFLVFECRYSTSYKEVVWFAVSCSSSCGDTQQMTGNQFTRDYRLSDGLRKHIH